MKIKYQLSDLLYLMERLRDPEDGCPWDVKQSYRSIAPSTIEEAYEVVDAIESENYPHLKEELGDLLFQVIFYSQLAREEERFQFSDVVSSLVDKLIRRHPHVFPDGTLQSRSGPAAVLNTTSPRDEQTVKNRWEAIKQSERKEKGHHGVLDDVPPGLPALTRAAKLQKRAAGVGFDWPEIEGVIAKIEEELGELKEALVEGNEAHIQHELGDLLFATVNACRHSGKDPESALRASNSRFVLRFEYIEQQLQRQGISPSDAPLEVLDQLWDEAKQNL